MQSNDVIRTINEILSIIRITKEAFPDLPNPFKNLPNLGSTPVNQLPPVVSGANPAIIKQIKDLVRYQRLKNRRN